MVTAEHNPPNQTGQYLLRRGGSRTAARGPGGAQNGTRPRHARRHLARWQDRRRETLKAQDDGPRRAPMNGNYLACVVRVAICACQEVGEFAQTCLTKSMDEQMANIPSAGSDFSPDWNRPAAAVHE